MITRLLHALAIFAIAGGACAQDMGDGRGEGSRDDGRSPYTVSLVTVGPGETYWQRFGHNAILIQDHSAPDGPQAISYNYGMFDFEQENFLLNFLRGRLLYRMEAFEGAGDLAWYLDSGRRVTIQRLDLAPDEITDLIAFLEWNRQPDNAEYLYDYFFDNCSTRVRDALDRVLGGTLADRFDEAPAATTLRWHVRRLTSPQAWLYLGTHLGLGRPVDRPIDRWDEFFIPMELADGLASVRRTDGAPLVRSTRVLAEGRVAESSQAPRSWPWLLLTGMFLGALAWRFRVVAGAWWTVSGLLGLGLAALSLTDHQAAWWNQNLLLFSPLALIVVLAPKRSGLERGAAILVAAGSIVALLLELARALVDGWVLQNQVDFLALCLPLTAAALARLHLSPSPARSQA